jgi:hypothetical protein
MIVTASELAPGMTLGNGWKVQVIGEAPLGRVYIGTDHGPVMLMPSATVTVFPLEQGKGK